MLSLSPWFLKNNSWSFSKHRTFERCKRQYYYSYIAPFLLDPSPHFDINTIKRLKEFRSRIFLQGDIIHKILEEQIDLFRKTGAMDPKGAIEKFSQKVAQNKMMASEVLIEYRHGEPVGDLFFANMQRNGTACLQTFFDAIWPDYRGDEYLMHEKLETCTINGTAVTVKVDYVSRSKEGTIVITDWKTGSDNEDFENEMQIASYVIWAMQHFGKSPDEIRSELVYLKTGETRPFVFFREHLLDIEEKIKADFALMNASYEYGDFPARPRQAECMSCPFGGVCPDSGR